jgi:hypothetical protein
MKKKERIRDKIKEKVGMKKETEKMRKIRKQR